MVAVGEGGEVGGSGSGRVGSISVQTSDMSLTVASPDSLRPSELLS